MRLYGRIAWWFLLIAGGACNVPENPFVKIPGGKYIVGAKNHGRNPVREITVQDFWLSKTEVTNAQFAEFVKATGYVTTAEKSHNARIFYPGLGEFQWADDTTACWRYPNGISRGGIEDKMDHPVTTISFKDVQAYCDWAGVRLPTLEEWEVASRGSTRTAFFWGNQPDSIGKYANVWHGKDHLVADSADAWMLTAPVGSFPPNPFGLYDMYGNVFELCEGRSKGLEDQTQLACARGGSWWCSRSACTYFNSVDIGRVNQYASFSNQGFRVVRQDAD